MVWAHSRCSSSSSSSSRGSSRDYRTLLLSRPSLTLQGSSQGSSHPLQQVVEEKSPSLQAHLAQARVHRLLPLHQRPQGETAAEQGRPTLPPLHFPQQGDWQAARQRQQQRQKPVGQFLERMKPRWVQNGFVLLDFLCTHSHAIDVTDVCLGSWMWTPLWSDSLRGSIAVLRRLKMP